MRRKARPLPRGNTQGNANSNAKAKENAHLKAIKQTGRPIKTPTGKGLGKAGAKRLGRLLKRAIQDQEESTGKVSLPKTPVRLFKHQIQTKAKDAPKTNTTKPASPQVSQLILSVVSQCKHKGGMSMAELKQTLAAEGYDVSKNSKQVNMVTKRLVNNETLVRTRRHASLRLNNKVDTKQVKISSVKPPKPKADLKQSKTARKSPKGAGKSQRQARVTPKPKGNSAKPRGKSPKLKGKTHRTAAKSHKLTSKTRKAAARLHKPRRKTLKASRKSPKPAVKRRRSATKQAARVQKASRKAQRVQRRRPKQNRHSYKSSWKRQPQRRRLPKTRSKTRRLTRRRTYYYYN
ncbi:histone H1 [Larimichthys crocea]|uniref:histone H1 n=1 Tax=Larimichthys crocea TaxID=215358 RepID=UPI000F5F0200|nr:histone H1 [Larimichthys crocea]